MLKSIWAAALLCLPLQAGTVLFTDFGSGYTYNTTTGWGVENASGLMGIAAPIDPTTTGILGQVDIALAYFDVTAPVDSLTIDLETDSGGVPSGTVLESWTLAASSVTGTAQVFSFTSLLNPTLTAGTPYWLILSTDDPNGYVWLENSQGINGKAVNESGQWNLQPALTEPVLDLISTTSAVPEPGYAAITGALLLGVWRVRKRP